MSILHLQFMDGENCFDLLHQHQIQQDQWYNRMKEMAATEITFGRQIQDSYLPNTFNAEYYEEQQKITESVIEFGPMRFSLFIQTCTIVIDIEKVLYCVHAVLCRWSEVSDDLNFDAKISFYLALEASFPGLLLRIHYNLNFLQHQKISIILNSLGLNPSKSVFKKILNLYSLS